MHIRKIAEKYGQSHIFHFWDELADDERSILIKNAEEIDFSAIERILGPQQCVAGIDDRLSPPDPSICGSLSELRQSNPQLLEKYVISALKAVSENKVAVLLLAGGQGTRLGVRYPKGLYEPNLPSGRSLYQLQAERILRVAQLAKEHFGNSPSIPWYIMTSEHTQQTTMEYFKSHNYFGHDPDAIIFFEQFTLPAFDFNGKILLESKYKLCTAPDGNGGLYRALKEHGILDNMKSRGVEYIQIYCVDNILVKLPDLHFIGFCINESADCAAQVVQKIDPEEPIGVVGVLDGRYKVVEYSEISPSTASLRMGQIKSKATGDEAQPRGDHTSKNNNNNNNNRLVFSHGNICVHFATRSFLESIIKDNIPAKMSYHRALKKVTHVDLATGEEVVPTKPNAIKMEQFVFDVFPFAKHFAIWEVPRNEQFSPLKNGPGADKYCPKTSRADLLAYHAQLARSAGAQLGANSTETVNCNMDHKLDECPIIEISPLVSYAGENLTCLKGKFLTGVNLVELDRDTGEPVLIPVQSSHNNH